MIDFLMVTGISFWVAASLFLIATFISIVIMFYQSYDFTKRAYKYKPGKKNLIVFLNLWFEVTFNEVTVITWSSNNVTIHRKKKR